MKKILFLSSLSFILLFTTRISAQVISENAKRKVTVGVDVYTDIWQYSVDGTFLPSGFRARTINQGANVFIMYNLAIGETLHAFSIGAGIRSQNMYTNSRVADVKGDSIIFNLIPDKLPNKVDYRKTKINLTYVEIPIEFKFKWASGFKFGVGFKGSYLIDSKEKYVGTRPESGAWEKVKNKDINYVQDFAFGATLRVGYKFISVFTYYQITKVFEVSRGPELYPISVGITITPF
ncbi:MAG: PorT family protein [Bacteroidales bacterium]|nr:PorT family protein [Bacteroidales bacterium]